MRLTGFQ